MDLCTSDFRVFGVREGLGKIDFFDASQDDLVVFKILDETETARSVEFGKNIIE